MVTTDKFAARALSKNIFQIVIMGHKGSFSYLVFSWFHLVWPGQGANFNLTYAVCRKHKV